MKSYAFRSEAAAEYAEAIEYYANISPSLGKRFASEIDRLIEEICQSPRQYREYDPPMRRHFSRSFPYAVLYLDNPEQVLIFTVMHMKRRPGYWKSRLS